MKARRKTAIAAVREDGPPARRPQDRQDARATLEAKNRELTRTLQIIEDARANLADQYDFAPMGFVTLDGKGCIREINLTAARMLGRERSQLLAMPFFTQLASPHLPAFLHHLRECRRRPREILSEVSLRAREGTTVPVELRSVPVIDPRRGDTVFRTTLTDITERQRASQALRESEERYRELVEFSPDGIFILSEGMIVFANAAAAALCGAESAQALVGGEFLLWARPAFRPALDELLGGAFGGREAPGVEARLAREDHAAVDVEVAARAFRYEGEPAVLVVARDITRRRQAERHVLAISDRERARFGRDLHDSFCQNLMGAACMAEALRNKLRKLSPAAAAEAAQIAQIVRSCVEEARNLARGLCPVTMEASGLVAALHELTAEVVARTRVGCALECDDLLTLPDVNVATHVFRITQEAVANAITHGKAKAIAIRLAATNGKMTLSVEDNGKGFPARPRQSGMGLHTMRYRAAIIGGSLEVQRQKPRGTIMTCTFPSHAETP